jgi:hypothetical protein
VSAVFLHLSPAIARSGASLDLAVARAAVAELTPAQRETWALMKQGASFGIGAGAVVGSILAFAGLGASWPIVGPVVGVVAGGTAGPTSYGFSIRGPRQPG